MTSENPTDKDHPAINTDAKAADHKTEPDPKIPPAVAIPDPPPPPTKHCEITVNTKRDRIDWWTIRFEGFGLFVLVVYTIFTGLMYCANRDAANAAKNAANTADATLKEIRLENRPWVVVKSASVLSVKPMEQAQVAVIFSNFGHTPALDTKLVARLHMTSDPKADVPEIGSLEDELTSAILAPTMEMTIALHGLDTLNAAYVERATMPDVRYYIYGNGTYRDTTTERVVHHLEFCVFARYGILGITPCTGKRYKNTTD